ncbi:hypothetical protein CR205_13370 [Alteribacter lacisalsi]|uniref:Uncharacterized protein n=1 Tax=Alteribacter lacisalsi TaxID=2045244 RepID=A0A2W0H4D1_9BACI|nr:hypothetical protein [Alteribacter lacisalsi]PYZ96684.1 hypothetical protein CR205_13370 [Alteribacter lacisalsi]
MNLTEESLRDLIDGRMVGNKYPYDTMDEKEITAHMKRLFYRMNRIPDLVCEAEWDHFGSGYASFVEFFCYRKQDVTILNEKNGMKEIEIKGIIVDVCRLAPAAIMGEDVRTRKLRVKTNEEVSGAYGSLIDRSGEFHVSRKFEVTARQLERALREFDYELLKPEQLYQSLPFSTKIPTIYRKPEEYIVLDALFYWED